MKGGNFLDVLKDPIGTIKEAFRKVPSKLNHISTETINKYGNLPISGVTLIRTPLSKIWTGALNAISFGQFNKLQKEQNIDKLYHVGLIVQTPTPIIIEKNEVVNVAPLNDKKDLNKETQYYHIPINTTTISNLIANTEQLMGKTAFYDYDALRNNNCQNFIISLLKANNIWTDGAQHFIFQNIQPITQQLSSHVPTTVKTITSTGSVVSRLIGKGKQHHKIDPYFIKFVKNNGFRFL